MSTKKKSAIKPKLCALYNKTAYLLMKNAKLKHHYIPLTPEQQANYLSPDSPAEEVTQALLMGIDLIELDEVHPRKRRHGRRRKHGRKQKRARKKASKKLRKACRTFCKTPDMLSDPKSAWVAYLICLLASKMDLIAQNLPGVPVVHLKDVTMLPKSLKAILKAIHGPTKLKKKGVFLKRPYYVQAVVPLGATAPSVAPEDYFGGYAKVYGTKRFFWLPLRNETVAIAANVPQAAWKPVIEQSRLAVPMFCSVIPKLPNRPVFELDGTAFNSYDPDRLKALKKQSKYISIVLDHFDQWLRHKRKRWKRCVKDARKFYPKSQNGRFVTEIASDEIRIISLALAVFKQFLRYASTVKKWLSPDKAQAILLDAWNQLLPESAPNSANRIGGPSVSWNEPDVFWSFLGRYLQENQKSISLSGAPCKRDTTAVIHELPDGKFLILPREQLAKAYADDLTQKGAALPGKMDKWGVDLQKSILDWGVPVKTESNGPSWRFAFYEKGATEKDKLPCLAFPLAQLPQSITNSLSDWFGEAFEAILSPQGGRSKAEPGKVMESGEISSDK